MLGQAPSTAGEPGARAVAGAPCAHGHARRMRAGTEETGDAPAGARTQRLRSRRRAKVARPTTAARPMARNTNTGVNDMEAPSVLDGPGPGRGLVTTGCCARPSPTAVAWPALSPRPGSLIPARPAPATLHCTVAAPRS